MAVNYPHLGETVYRSIGFIEFSGGYKYNSVELVDGRHHNNCVSTYHNVYFCAEAVYTGDSDYGHQGMKKNLEGETEYEY